jgi:hypothetical protein
MNFNQASHWRNFFRKSIVGLVEAIFLAVLLHAAPVRAEDAVDFRTRVIQEVLQEVPDLELAKQIVEIRINREFLKSQSASKSPAQQRVLIREPAR